MHRLSIAKSAAAAGAVGALLQAIWVLLVGSGGAKSCLDFLLTLEFARVAPVLDAFSATTAFFAVAIAFCIAAFCGATFATVWNSLTLAEAPEWERDTQKQRALSPPL